jgi:hypothetical protein
LKNQIHFNKKVIRPWPSSSLTKIYQSRKENEWLQEEAQQTRRESVRFASVINSAFQGAPSLSPGRGGGGVIN